MSSLADSLMWDYLRRYVIFHIFLYVQQRG